MPKGLGACCWSMGWTGRPFGDGITARVASATNTLHPGSRYWEAQTAEAARASEQLGTATLPCAAPRCQEARSGCVVGGQGRPTADGRGSPSSLGPIANGDARHAQSCPTRRRVRGPRRPSSRVDVLLGRCIASSVVVFLRDRNGGHRAARPGQHPERKKREAPLETTGASRSEWPWAGRTRPWLVFLSLIWQAAASPGLSDTVMRQPARRERRRLAAVPVPPS